jgi:hypothetical protein
MRTRISGDKVEAMRSTSALLPILLTAACSALHAPAPPAAAPSPPAAAAPSPPAAAAPSQPPAVATKPAEATPAPATAAKAPEKTAPIIAAEPATSKAPAAKAPAASAKPPARVAAAPAATPAATPTAKPPAATPPAATPPAATLDLTSLEARLRETKAIGTFTKLALKNQVDDLLAKFRAYHEKHQPPLAELRQPYEMLIMKVLSLLQDGDPSLARTISDSREALWALLADKSKFTSI